MFVVYVQEQKKKQQPQNIILTLHTSMQPATVTSGLKSIIKTKDEHMKCRQMKTE